MIQKAQAILYSLLLLLSTTGLTYGQHFCEGVVVEVALAFGAEKMDCNEAEAEDACDDAVQEADCCADVYYQLQTDTEFAAKSFESISELPVFDASVPVYALFATAPVKEQQTNTQYLPPEITNRDRQALYQVFII